RSGYPSSPPAHGPTALRAWRFRSGGARDGNGHPPWPRILGSEQRGRPLLFEQAKRRGGDAPLREGRRAHGKRLPCLGDAFDLLSGRGGLGEVAPVGEADDLRIAAC